MRPYKFDGSNGSLSAPPGMEGNCETLPIYTNGHFCLSRWKMSCKERLLFILTGKVWLTVIGWTQPPVNLSIDDPRKVTPMCPATPLHRGKFYRLEGKGSEVYECACGCIFTWQSRHKFKTLVNPLADAELFKERQETQEIKETPGPEILQPGTHKAFL